jgi:alpha-glucosidase/alpha-D-xyloside xylohydrolase
MAKPINRRTALKRLGTASAALLWPRVIRGEAADIIVAGQPVEIAVWSLAPSTARITIRPLQNGNAAPIAYTGALAQEQPGESRARARAHEQASRVRAGDLIVRYTADPPTLHIDDRSNRPVQTLRLEAAAPGMSFKLPSGPLLGMGEGGPQFDRKGSVDTMRNGQGGFRLATHGTRAPVQWLIGTSDGWAMFIHQPYGQFDFTGSEGRFSPSNDALPLDVFIINSRDPAVIMREYARISGLPELPALWTFGYQQSHRTLAGPDEIMSVARTMREKKLPCDTLIYLGTDFTPSGWNTHNGEFTWREDNFPDPRRMVDELHAQHYKVVLHIVIEGRRLTGAVTDPCKAAELPSGRTPDGQWPPDREAACYWPIHKTLMDVGVDGWWPDQGDGLDGPSRLNRHRMYWEGTQLYRPNERPFALHRNASPGIQRYGGFIWSGDTRGQWETLKTHIPVAINSGLSGFPYWGSDIGGFYPTAEYTGELHLRWFQFGSFCPSFRAHGRHWHLRVPWGWDGGDGGPMETNWRADPAELNNKEIEPISRKYLELRYRMLPYIYTAARAAHETGMPMMRALWLHHPDDANAVARGYEFFWGPDILVAPVFEKGATSRRLYLPRGTWYDFWTEERVEGGREIDRAVDLATTPMYVRAGAVLPLGPVKQYSSEPSSEPMTLVVYPGVDGLSSWYEDDGVSFEHRQGVYMRTTLSWREQARRLSLALARGSRMLPPNPRKLAVRVAGSSALKSIEFNGRSVSVVL